MPRNTPESHHNRSPAQRMTDIFRGRVATQPDKQGFAPPYQSFSDFQWDEEGTGTNYITSPREDVCSVNVPRNLRRRKLYAWLWVNNLSSDYKCIGTINFFLENSRLGNLPLSIALSNALITSKVNTAIPTITSGGAVVQDTMGFFIGNRRLDQPTAVNLQPLYITGEIDRATVSIKEMVSVNFARVLIAITSSI